MHTVREQIYLCLFVELVQELGWEEEGGNKVRRIPASILSDNAFCYLSLFALFC